MIKNNKKMTCEEAVDSLLMIYGKEYLEEQMGTDTKGKCSHESHELAGKLIKNKNNEKKECAEIVKEYSEKYIQNMGSKSHKQRKKSITKCIEEIDGIGNKYGRLLNIEFRKIYNNSNISVEEAKRIADSKLKPLWYFEINMLCVVYRKEIKFVFKRYGKELDSTNFSVDELIHLFNMYLDTPETA